jgi:hypothetical protein
VGEASDRQKVTRLRKSLKQVAEPDVKKLSEEALENKMFIFQESGDYRDYFRRLKEYRKEVIETLYSIIDPAIIKILIVKEAPVIGVHIRMGDFRMLKAGEKYRSGHVRTPKEFFIDCVDSIRKLNGNSLPVTLFTDGYKHEVKEILQLEKVKIAERNPDIIDLLLLSKSKIILPTHGSTFSAWAAFLSEAPVVLPFPYEKSLREGHIFKNIFEGKFDLENEILRMNIKSIIPSK